MDILEILANKH